MANKLSRMCRQEEAGGPEEGTACTGVGSAEAPPRLEAPSLGLLLEHHVKEPGMGQGLVGTWSGRRAGARCREAFICCPKALGILPRVLRSHGMVLGKGVTEVYLGRPTLAALLRKGFMGDSLR